MDNLNAGIPVRPDVVAGGLAFFGLGLAERDAR